MKIYENEEFSTKNILAVNRTLTASGMHNLISGLGSQDSEHELTISVIEVKPNDGVYYDINRRFGTQKMYSLKQLLSVHTGKSIFYRFLY